MLANNVLDALRHRHIILPPLDVVERVCAEAITRANRRIYDALAEPLSDMHRRRLDDLLKRCPHCGVGHFYVVLPIAPIGIHEKSRTAMKMLSTGAARFDRSRPDGYGCASLEKSTNLARSSTKTVAENPLPNSLVPSRKKFKPILIM